jgi:hypothetical protein
VILSGHDEFRAQEAIQLGVTEYLLAGQRRICSTRWRIWR